MANNEKDLNKTNGGQVPEGTPAESGTAQTEMVVVNQKGGFGTAVKTVAGITLGVVLFGLGYFVRGVLGGARGGDETEAPVETEGTVE